MQIKTIKRLTWAHKHHAFTDLCPFNDNLYCSYRVARDHISGDGCIHVLTLSVDGQVKGKQIIRLPCTDLRDPKLSVTPQGQLLLLAYARRTEQASALGQLGLQRPVVWVSQDGLSWSSPRNTGEQHWWLWRVRWHENRAYGFAYNRGANALHFYAGDPRRGFHRQKSNVFSLQTHGKGYPNETDMCFDSAGIAYTLLRRDSDSYSAQLGISHPPYNRWAWTDLGLYIGGPNMLMLDDGNILLAGRILNNNEIVTAILKLSLKKPTVTLFKVLPSSGDNSYPGMIKRGKTLYVSYYSSHQDNQAHIYLATLAL